jgi:N6-adenosine-specific RNA methylase IME4/ParB-like chromosome segregation protein Spo0J
MEAQMSSVPYPGRDAHGSILPAAPGNYHAGAGDADGTELYYERTAAATAGAIPVSGPVVIDEEFKGIIPPLTDEELRLLEESINQEGCRDPLVVWKEEGILLDGHNRYRICQSIGADFKTIELSFPDRLAATKWMVTNQLGRRNLVNFQRCELVAYLEKKIAEDAKKRQEATRFGAAVPMLVPPSSPGKTQDKMADLAELSHGTWDKYKAIKDKIDDDTKQALREGDISINAAYTELKREEKRKQRELDFQEKVATPPPAGKYRCIVIDPPWPMEKIQREVRPNQVAMDYPTMSIEEIKDFPIEAMADDAAHVYMWTTQRFLPDAFEIMEAWDVDYIFTMVWHKPGGFQPVGLAQYNCEFVLFGRRGGLPFADTKNFMACFEAERREHSRKPDEFYDVVRRVSPGPRIDVFSREPREAFDQYGNETNRF